MLGNLYLGPVDDVFRGLGRRMHYSRYMDDIIVVGRRRDVIEALHTLEEVAQTLGVAISSGKTSLEPARDARKRLADPELASLNVLYKTGRTTADVTDRMRRLVRDAMDDESGTIDTRRAKFSLRRLAKLSDADLDKFLLKRLEYYAPVADLVCRYIKPRLDTRKVRDGLATFLEDQDRCLSDYLSTWILAAMVARSGTVHPVWRNYAMARTEDPTGSAYERAMAMSVVGLGRKKKGLRLLHDIATDSDEIWDRRAAVIALARGGALPAKLKKGWTKPEFLNWTASYAHAGPIRSPLVASW